jgi:hypothetical protein
MKSPSEKAKELFDRYCQILGSNCEHESYCQEPECNKLGFTFCKVSYKDAKEAAIIAVNYRIEALEEMWLWDAIDEQKEIIEEIEKL